MEPIGERIRRHLKEQGLSVKEFAEALGIQRPNAYRIFSQRSIDTDLLLRISAYLRHDFFRDYSARLLHGESSSFDTGIKQDT